MNPLYHTMNNQQNDLLRRFNEFQKTFSGDPRQKVQELLNSGRVSQAQYNHAVQQAEQFRRMLGK